MYGWVDFRDDEKKRRENDKRKLFGGYLVGKGREKNVVGPECFLLGPTKKCDLLERQKCP